MIKNEVLTAGEFSRPINTWTSEAEIRDKRDKRAALKPILRAPCHKKLRFNQIS